MRVLRHIIAIVSIPISLITSVAQFPGTVMDAKNITDKMWGRVLIGVVMQGTFFLQATLCPNSFYGYDEQKGRLYLLFDSWID